MYVDLIQGALYQEIDVSESMWQIERANKAGDSKARRGKNQILFASRLFESLNCYGRHPDPSSLEKVAYRCSLAGAHSGSSFARHAGRP